MTKTPVIISIDQGTTGTTILAIKHDGSVFRKAYEEFAQIYPKPGWVEHDPLVIWQTVFDTLEKIMLNNHLDVKGIGITNQRETTVLWSAKTGKPLYNAIVWQCRRTESICQNFKGHAAIFKAKTGLPLDPYFSATKIRWILDQIPTHPIDDIRFGTIDSWVIWNLTQGKQHVTDFTNASRTLLFNIHEKTWDKHLCNILDIPISLLPEVVSSQGMIGEVCAIDSLKNVPIAGIAGDQQAALFGQTCFAPGSIKNTYGTGCFVMMNTGDKAINSKHGLLTTLAVNDKGESCYALEGSVFMGGATIQWLRDELKIITNAEETASIAQSIDNTDGVYLVPAFVGLGAPNWEPNARALLTGMTRGTNYKHIIRAALEAMAYQSMDVIEIMEDESGISIKSLNVDGGAANNNFLMQFQADILSKEIIRPKNIETTGLGAAYLAGLAVNFWQNSTDLKKHISVKDTFKPSMNFKQRNALRKGWAKAIQQTLAGLT
jgi:glycerol kinase